MKQIYRHMKTFFMFFLLLNTCKLTGDELPWIDFSSRAMELDLVSPFIPENPIIVEAGAHHGCDTIYMSAKWPQGKIYSFEPCESSYLKLIDKTKDLLNVKTFPFGLFSSTGYFTFNYNPSNDGASSLLDDNHLPGLNLYNDQKSTVFCMNLDEWAISESIQSVDYMWLDMEGSEIIMLKAAPTILSTVKAISIEANFLEFRKGMSLFSDLKDFLESHGFKLYKIWGDPNWQATAVFIELNVLNENLKDLKDLKD